MTVFCANCGREFEACGTIEEQNDRIGGNCDDWICSAECLMDLLERRYPAAFDAR
jgi:hypothetical protein